MRDLITPTIDGDDGGHHPSLSYCNVRDSNPNVFVTEIVISCLSTAIVTEFAFKIYAVQLAYHILFNNRYLVIN